MQSKWLSSTPGICLHILPLRHLCHLHFCLPLILFTHCKLTQLTILCRILWLVYGQKACIESLNIPEWSASPMSPYLLSYQHTCWLAICYHGNNHKTHIQHLYMPHISILHTCLHSETGPAQSLLMVKHNVWYTLMLILSHSPLWLMYLSQCSYLLIYKSMNTWLLISSV